MLDIDRPEGSISSGKPSLLPELREDSETSPVETSLSNDIKELVSKKSADRNNEKGNWEHLSIEGLVDKEKI